MGIVIAVRAADRDVRGRIVSTLEDGGFCAVVAAAEEEGGLAGDESAIVVHSEHPGGDATVRALKGRYPDVPVIATVDDCDEDDVRALLNAGADGIVARGQLDGALVAAVECARAGQLSVPASLRMSLDRPLLTSREKQILGMVIMDFPNCDIADRLFLAESTIKSHLGSAFRKLGVRSRKEATALILDESNGLGTGILGILQV